MRSGRTFAVVALLVAVLSLPPSPALAQADAVDDYIRSELLRQKIPGLSLAIVRNGEIVRAKGYGLSNVELSVAATPATIFQSGSVGKQFTATLVMMLVEEGRMGLEDRIAKFIPEAPAIWSDITIRHLLTHTSGISNRLYDSLNMRQDYTEDELVRRIAAIPLDFAPGAKWSYSNPGYVMLGIIIRKVTGTFYGDFLKERIFTPLGMTTARIISESDLVPNRAAGYHLVKGEVKNQNWVAPALNTTADGSLYLTVLDMAKWDAALYTETLLKKASLERMWTPVRLSDGTTHTYGFGWSVGEVNGQRIIEHGGAWQGFKSYIARYVGKGLTVIIMTNLAETDPGHIAHGVAAALDPALKTTER